MKQCSKCNQVFSNQDTYCLHDGSVLIEVTDSGQTPPINYVSNEMPTQVISSPQATNSLTPNKSSAFLYSIIGLMSVIILVMGIFIFLPTDSSETAVIENESKSKDSDADDKKSFSTEDTEDDSRQSYTSNVDANKIETSPAQQPMRPSISPEGRWSGDWSSPSGAYLTVVFDLDDDGAGNINGQIKWTLRRTNRPEKMGKIGMSATEYVRGRFNPANQLLTLKGYRKDDPNGVLVMVDDYRLNLSNNNRRLNGKAKNGGKWNGRINLSR